MSSLAPEADMPRMSLFSDDDGALPRSVPPELHGRYLEREIERVTRPTRAAIAVTISVVALFGIRDWVVDPHTAHITTVLRGASIALGLVAIFGGATPQRRKQLALLFIYGVMLSHATVISLLPLGFRYQLTSLLILPLGASLFMPETKNLYRLQGFAVLVVQAGLWYQAPPRLDVVAAESALLLTTFVTALLGTMGIRVRQRQFLAEHRLREEATRDELTGLHNRRYLERAAHEELRRAVRFHRPLAVVVVDIDKFKRVNDSYGHAVGDQVIKATGKCLLDAIRDHDVLARIGGEEFVVLLPETPLEGAMALAERLRSAVAALQVEAGGPRVTWTVSCGVTEVLESDQRFEEVLDRADACLYTAKGTGRNRVSSTPILRVTEALRATLPGVPASVARRART
jgi:diguanylate cyclase (GGDEF)-like protein